jgi:hypothetical protein
MIMCLYCCRHISSNNHATTSVIKHLRRRHNVTKDSSPRSFPSLAGGGTASSSNLRQTRISNPLSKASNRAVGEDTSHINGSSNTRIESQESTQVARPAPPILQSSKQHSTPLPRHRANQCWVFANNHAKPETIGSKRMVMCLYCSQHISSNNHATTPIIKHLLRRHDITKDSAPGNLNNSLEDRQVDGEEFKKRMVEMLIECRLPFSIVEQPTFRQLLNYVCLSDNNTDITIPSIDDMRKLVQNRLDQINGR